MSFELVVNHKTYIVIDHAATRMFEREITEAMIISTMEEGNWFEQSYGREVYEREFAMDGVPVLFQVVVQEEERRILTVLFRPF